MSASWTSPCFSANITNTSKLKQGQIYYSFRDTQCTQCAKPESPGAVTKKRPDLVHPQPIIPIASLFLLALVALFVVCLHRGRQVTVKQMLLHQSEAGRCHLPRKSSESTMSVSHVEK
ncbi:hypothetical protein VTO42DRAFT_7234 [Malbranchea cinnamomea]